MTMTCAPGDSDSIRARSSDDVPPKLSPEQARIFRITDLDPFPRRRRLRAAHYPASNEYRIDLFQQHIKGLRGGYIGVGTDQNFTFIAWARSEYAWLIDFNPVIVAVNRIHILFLKEAPTYGDFRALWTQPRARKSFELIRKRFLTDEDYPTIVKAWRVARRGSADVPERLKELDKLKRRFGLDTFSSNPRDYAYVRGLALAGRMQAISGNLLGNRTIPAISASARKLNTVIRVMYTSNAEDYFRGYKKNFRESIKGLPLDARGMLIRTVSWGAKRELGWPKGEKYVSHPFHYNIQPLQNLRAWMAHPKPLSIVSLMRKRTRMSRGFSRIIKEP